MGYHGNNSRACREGWLGRRRNYKCRACGETFQHDGLQLPEKLRVCSKCLYDTDTRLAYRAEVDRLEMIRIKKQSEVGKCEV